MASSSTLSADFIQLQETVFVSYGDRSKVDGSKAHEPSIILLLGWLGGLPSHLFKYARVHRSIYPLATILVVETPASFVSSSVGQREKRLQPVADILASTIYGGGGGDDNRGLLIHTISNGGCFQLMTLAQILQRRHESLSDPLSHPTIPIALVIDSAPGMAGFVHMLSNFVSSTHSLSLDFYLTITFLAYYALKETLSSQPLVPTLEKYMGQPKLVPLASKATPRLYIYSDVDPMTPMRRVEKHIAAMTGKGYHITAEKYIGSEHVSHMRKDPERYWKAVRRIWDNAVDNSRSAVDSVQAKL